MSNTFQYTDVDLNTGGATTVYDPNFDAVVHGVFMSNGGTAAEAQLEVTDGSSTAVIAESGAGGSLVFTETVALDAGQALQINVTAVEGSALTETAGASAGK